MAVYIKDFMKVELCCYIKFDFGQKPWIRLNVEKAPKLGKWI